MSSNFLFFCLGAGCKAFIRQPEKGSIDKGPETVKQFLQKNIFKPKILSGQLSSV